MSKVVHLDGSSFESEVLKYEGVVLVDFWAPWCGPCKMLGPILDEVSEEVAQKITKVNVDEQESLASQYKIRSIPTMIVFKNGEIVDTLVGMMQKQALKDKLASY